MVCLLFATAEFRIPFLSYFVFRTIRWLDRCLVAHKKPEKQCIFPIVQGGLHADLRVQCVKELVKRDVAGYAIGGLRYSVPCLPACVCVSTIRIEKLDHHLQKTNLSAMRCN